MSEALPHRAKPPLLHRIAKFLRNNDEAAEKSEIYDAFEENQKTIRRTMLYGVELGFLEQEGDVFRLTKFGYSLSGPTNFDDETVRGEFREAIERFDPYHETFLVAYDRGITEEVLGDEVLTQSALKEITSQLLDGTVENREINVLIKTAEAAGLGEYRAGKKGYESRLIISDRYGSFMTGLVEGYSIPETSESTAGKMREEEPTTGEKTSEEISVQEEPETTEQLKLTVEFDVEDKDRDEIAEIVKRVREAV
jgi:hypothetical protein